MGPEFTRRGLGEAVAGAIAAAALPNASEAQEGPLSFLRSSLTEEALDLHRERAVAQLKASIPPTPSIKYLFGHAEHLKDESQMYIPTDSERELVLKNSRDEKGASPLEEQARALKPGESGLYIFADIDAEGRHFQRMYVLKKDAGNRVRFDKAYRVSTSMYGFGNEEKSNQTPLGHMQVLSGEVGRYAEVVKAERNSDDQEKRATARKILDSLFNKVTHLDKTHWFARTFGEPLASGADLRTSRDSAEVVTARYTIDEKRGIHIHGTNRSGKWDTGLRKWITYLGGRRRSSGCIRMSNTDIYDLGLSQHIALPSYAGRRKIANGTSVTIYATPQARGIQKTGEKPRQTHPDDRERNLFEETDDAQAKPEPPRPLSEGHAPTKTSPELPRIETPIPKPKPRRNLFDEI